MPPVEKAKYLTAEGSALLNNVEQLLEGFILYFIFIFLSVSHLAFPSGEKSGTERAHASYLKGRLKFLISEDLSEAEEHLCRAVICFFASLRNLRS